MRTLYRYFALLLALAVVLGVGAVPALASPEASLTETVLADCDEAAITVTDYDPEEEDGPVFELLLENKSDRPLYMRFAYVAVNGVMCDTYFSETVPAGQKRYADMCLWAEDLEQIGVNYIQSVTVLVDISDDETFEDVYEGVASWDLDVAETDIPAVEPMDFGAFAPTEVFSGDTAMTVAGYDHTDDDEALPQLWLYLENNTDGMVHFSADDVAVNGFVCDPYWGTTLLPHTAAYSAMTWSQDDLDESHIDAMESVQFDARAMDEDWNDINTGAADIALSGDGGQAAAQETSAPEIPLTGALADTQDDPQIGLPAQGENIYTLEQALAMVGTDEGRVNNGFLELSDDFSFLSPLNEQKFTSDGGKTIILWREGPEKEYESSSTELPEGYTGTDVGKPRVFLCAELMEQMPEQVRAATLDEVDNVVMAETFYLHSGTMTSFYSLSDNSQSEPPSGQDIMTMFDSEEAGQPDIPEEEEEERYWQYVPFFSCLESVSVYNYHTGGMSVMDMEVFRHEEMRRNPSADDLWDNMQQLCVLISAAVDDALGDGRLSAAAQDAYDAGNFDFLDQTQADVLAAAVEGADAGEVVSVCDNIFWNMAPELKALDPDAEEAYDAAIDMRSYGAMQYIVNAREYSATDKSDWEIRLDKSYLGTPDLNVLRDKLTETTDLLDGIQWDMALISLVASMG